MKLSNKNGGNGLEWHCRVAALLINTWPDTNPHVNHHIRGAIREATLAVKGKHGSALKTTGFITPEAKVKLENGEEYEIVREHIVPVSVIVKKVFELQKPTEENIVDIVKRWTAIAAITREQDDLLRNMKLYKTMPKNWDGCDFLARYKAAGISVVEVAT